MRDIVLAAGEIVVHTQHIVAVAQQALAEMRAQEAGTTGHHHALAGQAHQFEAPKKTGGTVGGWAEFARAQAGVQPGNQRVDVVDRQSQDLAERERIGRHVGAFQYDRADVAMARYQCPSGVQDVGGGECDIHVLLLAPQQHAEEFAAVLGADDRRVGRYAGGRQMSRRQRSADTVMMPTRCPGGSIACTQGTWIRALVATGPVHALPVRLEQRQKPAVRGDRFRTVGDQFRRRPESRPAARRGVQHHPFRRRAAHHTVAHRERPGCGRCPCRLGFAETVPPASDFERARTAPCRPSR